MSVSSSLVVGRRGVVPLDAVVQCYPNQLAGSLLDDAEYTLTISDVRLMYFGRAAEGAIEMFRRVVIEHGFSWEARRDADNRRIVITIRKGDPDARTWLDEVRR